MFMKGYRRRQGRQERRRAVTTSMLRWIRRRLDIRRWHDDAAIWLAVLLGFLFPSRASEFVRNNKGTAERRKGIRG